MSFNIGGVEWTPVLNIDRELLVPVMSSLTDRELERKTIVEVGLEKAGEYPWDSPATSCRELGAGRMVLAQMINPQIVSEAIQLTREESPWFVASSHLVMLFTQRVQGCYGGWSERGVAQIFGEAL